ncbi:MAG: Glucose-6-phosphate 1-dehydrogenase [Ignavibacteriaceae bacterium]|nr:Glucose-6-phosphate 1-dehydrogenase [Ignavibacteriaceae bacterium]
MDNRPAPSVIVIFGASGDLTKRKLIPALYDLFCKNAMPLRFAVLGAARSAISDEAFRAKMAEDIRTYSENKEHLSDEVIERFVRNLYYTSLETENPDDYVRLKTRLEQLDAELNTGGNYIYYLASPPKLYETVAQALHNQGLHINSGDTVTKKLIIEKPFGYDLASALALNQKLHTLFEENQLYRIDHYLGKETVQNVLVLRFANGIFEPLWNRNYIDYVEITAAESIGVENRGGYYDTAGTLRDMVQNHLMQIAGLVAMEPPASFDSTSVRNETIKVFQSLIPIPSDRVEEFTVRGQYISSKVKGQQVKGYREEKDVHPDSRTETYAGLKFFIDNWRWAGVPFYMRAGKRLPTRVTEVVIHFKKSPQHLFHRDNKEQPSNLLIIRVQPDEGILMKFGMKTPGAGFKTQQVNMDFHYSELGNISISSAYERLLLDCMTGDSTLYARGDAVEACWRFVDPILSAWKYNPEIKLYGYPAGTWGPAEATGLFGQPGMDWRYPCKNLSDDGNYCEL